MGGQAERLDRQFLEEVCGGVVDQRVHGVEPEGVDVELMEPAQRIVEDVPAHLPGSGTVEVDVVAPDSRCRGEIGPKRPR